MTASTRTSKTTARRAAPKKTRLTNRSTSITQEWLIASDLHVDPVYERPLNKTKVSKIVRDFDPDALGSLYVSKRANGYWILDGQHRKEAAVEALGRGQRVPCTVYHGLTPKDEARLFVEFNRDRTRPRPLDLFRGDLAAGEKNAVAIDKVLRTRGLQFAGPGPQNLQCVRAVTDVQRLAGPIVLGQAIDICTQAFAVYNTEQTAYPGDIVKGLALLIVRKGTRLDQGRLVKVLAGKDPQGIVTRARTLRAATGVGGGDNRLQVSVAQHILGLYNTRLAEAKKLQLGIVTGPSAWKPEKDDE